jgi:hypothetical protein
VKSNKINGARRLQKNLPRPGRCIGKEPESWKRVRVLGKGSGCWEKGQAAPQRYASGVAVSTITGARFVSGAGHTHKSKALNVDR